MEDLYKLAEDLERKRLNWLKMNLFGFALGGLFRILHFYFFKEEGYNWLIVLQLFGFALWALSLVQLLAVGKKVKQNKILEQLFNDELTQANRLKSWKVGFIAVLVTQALLVVYALFYSYPAPFGAEVSIYVGVCTAIAANIILEEILAIQLFDIEFDEDQYEIWNWKKFSFFHYIINPGLAFNEFVLGQRIPKIMLIDKKSDKPFMERQYVPCPSCNTIHDGRIWSAQHGTAFKNWFGFYCPNCSEVIPCHLNIFTWVLLALTYPLWFWWVDSWKAQWLTKQPARFANVNAEEITHAKVNWLRLGLLFGVLMFIAFSVIFGGIGALLGNPKSTGIEFYLILAVLCALGGFGFGWTMKYMMGKKSTSSNNGPS